MTADDAHRGSEVARLAAVIETNDPGLRVVGISGPGGVGKSYLLSHVLTATEPARRTSLELSLDGSNEQARGDLFGLLDGQLARTSLPPPADPRRDYFPRLRKVAWTHRALVEAVTSELVAGAAPPEVRDTAVALLKAGRRLNKAVPITRVYFDAAAHTDVDAGQAVDDAWKLVANLRALQTGDPLPAALRHALGTSHKARVKQDLYNVTAEALVADLAAALGGHTARSRFASAPIPGKARHLLGLDDFEALAPTLEELIVGALLPRLAEAPFPSTVILLGRDDLEAMHPAWSQHCRRYLVDQIRLAPFSREAAFDLLARAEVPEARREELYQATQGFPFLLALLVEEVHGEAGGSALFLRRFFDRTTRWMSPREREWLTRVCYLDEVNLDTLAPLFPGESVERVQDWFEREASIRDPGAPVFRVRPLIREKVLRYLELRSPSRHRELMERARRPPEG